MKKKLSKYYLTFCILFLLIGVIIGPSINAISNEKKHLSNISYKVNNLSQSNDGYIDITVEETWTFLNDTTNGIQIPIDVRTDNEWRSEHIDTPPPENPRHHCLCAWDNLTIVQDFISTYSGEIIILYCRSGGRSVAAAEILIENEFTGTIYNMLGGITAWKEAGFPTIPNLKPEPPIITGKINGKAGIEYEYKFVSNDPEGDNLNYYIDWGDNNFSYVGQFESGEEVSLTKMWVEQGTYNITAKSIDYYLAESNLTIISINMAKNKLTSFNLILQILNQNHPIILLKIKRLFQI